MSKKNNINVVRNEFNAAFQRLDKVIYENLLIAGEKAVNRMRSSHDNDWDDQTGNLRSSCGFCIAHNGVIKTTSSFGVVKDGSEGKQKGESLAKEIARETSKNGSWCLVLVAGMEYASYVQQLHGKDVIEGASVIAERTLNELMRATING